MNLNRVNLNIINIIGAYLLYTFYMYIGYPMAVYGPLLVPPDVQLWVDITLFLISYLYVMCIMILVLPYLVLSRMSKVEGGV